MIACWIEQICCVLIKAAHILRRSRKGICCTVYLTVVIDAFVVLLSLTVYEVQKLTF